MRNNTEVRLQMSGMIERWQESGLSQKSFCEKESIKSYTFYYWYKRYRQQTQSSESQSGFVKLKIEKPTIAASVEVLFPDGMRLLFNEPVSPDYLKALIR